MCNEPANKLKHNMSAMFVKMGHPQKKSGGNEFVQSSGANDSSRAGRRGGFKREGFPMDLSFLFCPFAIFQGFSRLSRDSLGIILAAPTRNSPERVRDAIWTFPEKSGKPAGLENPRFTFSKTAHNLEAKEAPRNPSAMADNLHVGTPKTHSLTASYETHHANWYTKTNVSAQDIARVALKHVCS